MEDKVVYHIVINEEEKTFNAFDEDNFEFIPNNDWIFCTIVGDDNCNQVLGLLWKLLQNYNQVQPTF